MATWMRMHKTPSLVKNPFDAKKEKVPRSTVYKQYDQDGREIYQLTVEDDCLAELTVPERHELIAAMHRMDDRECDANNRENRLDPVTEAEYKKQKENFKAEFVRQNGRRPMRDEYPEGGHRTLISIQGMSESQNDDSDDMTGDKSKYARRMATEDYFAREKPSTAADVLMELMDTYITPREKEALSLIDINGCSKKEAGKRMGISGQRAGQLRDSAVKKLKASPELKKFFRNF